MVEVVWKKELWVLNLAVFNLCISSSFGTCRCLVQEFLIYHSVLKTTYMKLIHGQSFYI